MFGLKGKRPCTIKNVRRKDMPKNNDYVEYACTKIKESGLKITRPRECLIRFLLKADRALSPYEIRDELKRQKVKADVVTIYRVLDLLQQLGLVHKVLALNAFIRCHIQKGEKGQPKCHHYLLCRNCHRFEEFEGKDFSSLQKNIATYYQKFHIESHYLEFVGLCKNCQKKGVILKEHDTCLTHGHKS